MKLKKAKALENIFIEVDREFPDKSTEFCLEVAAQRARNRGYHGVDCSDIAEALFVTQPKSKT